MTMACEFSCSSGSFETSEGHSESTTHVAVLPEDVLDEVLVWAWLRSDWERTRWQFYHRMQSVSRAFRHIIRSVVLRFRCLETGLDFLAYHRMECARSSDYSYPYLRIRCDDLFSAHLVSSALHSFLDHCETLDIVFAPLTSVPRHLAQITSLLQFNYSVRSIALTFEFLRAFRRNEPSNLPSLLRLPSVKRLRIACTDTTGLVSLSENFWHWIVGPFPNVTDFCTNVTIDHILWPADLQYLNAITLQRLGPSAYVGDPLDVRRVDDALRKGAWRYLRTITIECDERKPSGWEDLGKACEKHGVELIQLIHSGVGAFSDHEIDMRTVGKLTRLATLGRDTSRFMP